MAQPIRVQKFFSDIGLLSRRAAEAEIEKGNVSVNGHPVTLGTKIDPKRDVVFWKGKRISAEKAPAVYIMLNKPRGYLCAASDDRGRLCRCRCPL